jgi:hypothetical protein
LLHGIANELALRELVEAADQTIVKAIPRQTIMEHDNSSLETDEEAIIPTETANLNPITTTWRYGNLTKPSSSYWLD